MEIGRKMRGSHSSPLTIPPASPDAITSGEEIARRLAGLIGRPFVLTGKTRTDGAKLRRTVAEVLLSYPLPPAAAPDAWKCVVPRRKGVPRLMREYIDTYIVISGTSYNLQVWNRNPTEPVPQIEYVNGSYLRANDVRLIMVRIDTARMRVRCIIVTSPDYIMSRFGKFGKPTVKQQLIMTGSARASVTRSSPPILFYPDDAAVVTSRLPDHDTANNDVHAPPSPSGVLPLEVIRDRAARTLIGKGIQAGATKTRGQELERIVAKAIGYRPSPSALLAGGYPDLRHQALEVKIQDAPTVDPGRYSPQFDEAVPECPGFTTRSIRYLIALMQAQSGKCEGVILCPGSRLGNHFVYVSDKSYKCQRSIPMEFFEAFDGRSVFSPGYP